MQLPAGSHATSAPVTGGRSQPVDAPNAPKASFVGRTIPLAGDKTLVIRPIAPSDVDGVTALYEGLSDEDRQRRFFAVRRLSRGFFEAMTTVADRGGFGLVALVDDADRSPSRIVGEAGYVLLADGDGELAIAVAREWRGWLGPCLLDTLLEAAASRAVPNLEGDVLTTNGPMLSLARSRGCAVMDHEDWSVVRVLIGTSGPVATWPGPHDRPRVLAEVPGGRWHGEAKARVAGLQVLACPGPAARRHGCPALAGEACPLAAGADAIVLARTTGPDRWPPLTEAHSRLHAGVPVCMEPAPVGTAGAQQSVSESSFVALVQRLATEHAGGQLRHLDHLEGGHGEAGKSPP